eukprot:Sspe_Gene.82459::Locus_54053_Transcript_1_1_Confidence_1.000_Length_2252::g.82459::m.82459
MASPQSVLGETLQLLKETVLLNKELEGRPRCPRPLADVIAQFRSLCHGRAAALALWEVLRQNSIKAALSFTMNQTGRCNPPPAILRAVADFVGVHRSPAAVIVAIRHQWGEKQVDGVRPHLVTPEMRDVMAKASSGLSMHLQGSLAMSVRQFVLDAWVGETVKGDLGVVDLIQGFNKAVQYLVLASPLADQDPTLSSQNALAIDTLLASAASTRALHYLERAPHVPQITAPPEAIHAEEEFSASIASTLADLTSDIPLVGPVSHPVGCSRAAGSLWLHSSTSRDLQLFYLQAYSWAITNPRMGMTEVGPVMLERLSHFTPPVEWPLGLWEAQQTQKLGMVLDALGKENFNIPHEVWSPIDTEYMPSGGGGSGEPSPLLISDWAVKAHHLLRELREDAAAAYGHRPQGDSDLLTDREGRWRAAKEVLAVSLGILVEFMSTTLNTLHPKFDRFGYGKTNLLSMVLCLSDLYGLLVEHLKGNVIQILCGFSSLAPTHPHPPRLDIAELETATCSPSGPHLPFNAQHLPPKLAVLFGVGVDKVLLEIDKIALRSAVRYCERARIMAMTPAERRSALGDDPDVEDYEEWAEAYSVEIDQLLRNTLHPLACVTARLNGIVRKAVLERSVESITAGLVGAVARECGVKLKGGDTPPGVPPLPTLPLRDSLTQSAHRTAVKQLFTDLHHFAQYLSSPLYTVDERTTLFALPGWLGAVRLEEALCAS